MPEVIALRKLRGFVHDCGGEVLESGAGLVRVRLGQSGGAAAPALAWLGLGKRSAGPVDVELTLSPSTPNGTLSIAVYFRPSHPSLTTDPAWKNRCTRLFIELRSYLMGGSVS